MASKPAKVAIAALSATQPFDELLPASTKWPRFQAQD
jgi:hypothetical protein